MTVKHGEIQEVRLKPKAKLPDMAMVLCAGKGTRMRPLTDDRPKALVDVAGKPLLARTLQQCAAAGVHHVVVNAHYKADALHSFLETWTQTPDIKVSDETDALLDTGGGVRKALPLLGEKRFFVINCDVVWRDGPANSLRHLARHWVGKKMDVLLLLVPMAKAIGIGDRGDFLMQQDGKIGWPLERKLSAFAFAGVQMVHPRAFDGITEDAFSMRAIWTKAIEAGRAYGCVHEGTWAHVGTPDSIAPAEAMLSGGGG